MIHRRLLLDTLLCGALALVFGLAGCQSATEEESGFGDLPFDLRFVEEGPPLRVNGAEVAPAMIRLIALSKQPQVLSHFRERFGAADREDFWRHDFGGQIPIDRLRRLTLREAVEAKLIQLIAVEQGLRPAAEFEYLRNRWREENERRVQAIAAGEDLYGPREYSLFEFFEQDMRSLSLAVRQKLEEKEVLRQIEDENWIPSGPESRVERMRRTYAIYLERQMENASVEVNRSRFQELDLVSVPVSPTG